MESRQHDKKILFKIENYRINMLTKKVKIDNQKNKMQNQQMKNEIE